MNDKKLKAGPFIKGLLKSGVNSGRAAERKMRRWWRVWPWDWLYYRRVIREGLAAERMLEEIKASEARQLTLDDIRRRLEHA